jgi:hypothetical protein
MKLFNVILILVGLSGCTWIEREYYYSSYEHQSDWSREYFEGEGGGKSVQSPAREVFTFRHEGLQLKVHASYLNMTFFGPVIVPIIPIPGDSQQNLSIHVEVITDNRNLDINAQDWAIKIIAPSNADTEVMKPSGVHNYMHQEEQKRDLNTFYRLVYPVEVSEADEIEIEFGPIKYGHKLLNPSKIRLKKIKGDWYFNGFTV